jgi:hypothetical protein
VLYPWKGRHVLCEGAILPYREFVSRTRLTDDAWMKLLDSKECPPCPKWFSPIVSKDNTRQPVPAESE